MSGKLMKNLLLLVDEPEDGPDQGEVVAPAAIISVRVDSVGSLHWHVVLVSS